MGTNENEGYTSVLILDIAKRDFDRLSDEVTRLLAHHGSSTPGLIEAALLGNDARTQLWLISRWESQHLWAASRWDRDIGQAITDLVESAVKYRIESLTPISIVRRPA